MRISDWSSDVCSSDLLDEQRPSDLKQAITTRTGPFAQWSRGLGRVHPISIFLQLRSAVRTLRSSEGDHRSEEHTSELQSLMRISYAVFCLKKKKKNHINHMKYTAEL